MILKFQPLSSRMLLLMDYIPVYIVKLPLPVWHIAPYFAAKRRYALVLLALPFFGQVLVRLKHKSEINGPSKYS